MAQDSGQPAQAMPASTTTYPQYVTPDASHVITATRTPSAADGNALVNRSAPPLPSVTVQDFIAFHVDPSGNTTVLVRSAAESTKASNVKGA